MEIQFLKNHIALSSSNEINEICLPLIKLGITYFSFIRSFEDGSHIRLSNNVSWTKHYYNRGFYNIVINQVPDSEGNILWSCLDRYPLFHEASEYFNIDNGTVMIVRADNVVERYFFGSTRDNTKINAMYLSQVDSFKRFILYFKEVAEPIINKAMSNKIVVPPIVIAKKDKTDEEFYNYDRIQEFLDTITFDKVSIRSQGKDVLISKNEAKILSLMKLSFTAKEISSEIGLTAKTVALYRDKLKIKLNQFTRGDLACLAKSNSLLDVNLFK